MFRTPQTEQDWELWSLRGADTADLDLTDDGKCILVGDDAEHVIVDSGKRVNRCERNFALVQYEKNGRG